MKGLVSQAAQRKVGGLMLQGLTAGFIVSLTLFPGTVWLARLGLGATRGQLVAVGLAFGLSQFLWITFAAPGLLLMMRHLGFLQLWMHLFAAFVLLYVAFKLFTSKRLERLAPPGQLPSAGVLFRENLARALAMPMRLPLAMAVLLSTGLYVTRPPEWALVPQVFVGAFLGVLWWWGQFTTLAIIFAKRVPKPVTLRSLNKIPQLGWVVYFILALIVVFLGL